MAKKLALALALLMLAAPALGEMTVERREGEAYFPSEKDWVYHFTYAYPHLTGEDYASAAINDTYAMALDEMMRLMLPMYANAEDMRFSGHNEVVHDFTVTCQNDHMLSILQTRSQSKGEAGDVLTLEPLVFDLVGDYAGETLTLRGVTLMLAGVSPDELDDVEAEAYPDYEKLIEGSSAQMAEVLLPRLYEEFQALQQAGVVRPEWTWEDFDLEFSPTRDFYADDQGRVVFFFQPYLLTEPSFDVPLFPFTPAELEGCM